MAVSPPCSPWLRVCGHVAVRRPRAPRRIKVVLTVNEIFHSIQGESTHSGRRCVFVRLTACDLRCSWCDTPYAFTEGRKVSVEDVVTRSEEHTSELQSLAYHVCPPLL